MYTIQALWTAARHNINVKFVVCNNGSYRLLQLNIDQFWREQGIEKHDFPLASTCRTRRSNSPRWRSAMSVPAVRVEKPWDIAAGDPAGAGQPRVHS